VLWAGIETSKPLFLLVDERTASASEVLSAALKENGRAKVVGKKTFGKVRDGCASEPAAACTLLI
jgi:C-terminal processing protease CtpA/Prc